MQRNYYDLRIVWAHPQWNHSLLYYYYYYYYYALKGVSIEANVYQLYGKQPENFKAFT
jgi:hypothetical protein